MRKPLLRALVAITFTLARVGWADCLKVGDPDVAPFQVLAGQDPQKALGSIKLAISDAQQASSPGKPQHLAALYAAEAEGYGLLELDAEARAAASAGLKLATDPTDPTHLVLQIAYAENVYDASGIDEALTTIERARRAQPRGSQADLCLQITLGRLQNRRGRGDLAIITLTQAYGDSLTFPAAEPRVAAAAALSPVLRALGDFSQALALNREAIDWYVAQHAKLNLSVTRYQQGEILSEMRDYKSAIEQIEQARKLSEELADAQGIGFADLAICRARSELGQYPAARKDCENALQIFSKSDSKDVINESLALLARLDLQEGHPDRALATLNEVLSHNGDDIQPRTLPSIYELRARVNAAENNYPDAYRDLEEYLKEYSARVDGERRQQVSALRARFETDREIERNAALENQLEITRERADRERVELRWVIAATSASGVVILLLVYLLISNVRYRKQLVRMANEDTLTGLPNRGSTAAVATEALEKAIAGNTPLSVALIDLDRFKALNDRFGHATGDRILREFARVARACVRGTDTLGRWGGEEFLMIMPDTTLDAAMEILDRIRQEVAKIQAEGWEHHVSISAGIATNGKGANTLDEIVARADVALYKAKNAGRDLVRYAEESFQSASTGVRRALRRP